MTCMTVGELLTYLKALPKETLFPIGLGSPFTINNISDQFIFRPKVNITAEEMAENVENLLGKTITSNTGALSVIQRSGCYAYFGLDEETPICPMNIVFLTILRAMEPATKEIKVSIAVPNSENELSTTFKVPGIWWDTLSRRHKNTLAFEYLTNQVLGGFTVSVSANPDANIKVEENTTETVDAETQTGETEENVEKEEVKEETENPVDTTDHSKEESESSDPVTEETKEEVADTDSTPVVEGEKTEDIHTKPTETNGVLTGAGEVSPEGEHDTVDGSGAPSSPPAAESEEEVSKEV